MRFKKPVFWDRKNPSFFSYLLFPLSLITMLISNSKKRAINKYPNIKTICVGNIYIGGTGKTPIAIELNKLLQNLNPIKLASLKNIIKIKLMNKKY